MQRLDGVVYDDVDAVAGITEDQGLHASYELVDVLARPACPSIRKAVGLGGFGPPPPGTSPVRWRAWQTQWEKSKDGRDTGDRRGGRSARTVGAAREPSRDRAR